MQAKEGMAKLLVVRIQAGKLGFLLIELVGPNRVLGQAIVVQKKASSTFQIAKKNEQENEGEYCT